MKALVTAGGTHEYIDSVRSIINHSTGRLGSIIADLFGRNGADVTYVCGEQAALPSAPGIRVTKIKNTRWLLETLEELLNGHKFDCVVHSMAVSDFTPHTGLTLEAIIDNIASAVSGQDYSGDELKDIIRAAVLESGRPLGDDKKISSKTEDMMLWLKQTPKIIRRFRELQPGAVLVGFKLLSGAAESELLRAAQTLLAKNSCDYVLANDLRDISGDAHRAVLIDAHNKIIGRAETKQEIAQIIYAAVTEKRRPPSKENGGLKF